MPKQNKKLNFKSDKEAEEYFKKHPVDLSDAQLNPYLKNLPKDRMMLIKIERDLLTFFGNEQKINAVLRQVIELDKTLHV